MYRADFDYDKYKSILQLLIKRKNPDFVFTSPTQWCVDSCCLLCGENFKPVTNASFQKIANHIVMHLKEKNLLPFT